MKETINIPSAKEALQQLAAAEAERAAEEQHRLRLLDNEKKALLEKLSKPSGISDEEALARGAAMLKRAVKNGLSAVEVIRFPNILCTDKGRAINQREAGWEKTLTGAPKEIYDLWYKHLRERGYKIQAEIVDFPDGVPGDIGLTIRWG